MEKQLVACISLVLCLLPVSALFSQSDPKAMEILDQVSTHYQEANGITATFTIETQAEGEEEYRSQGELKMQEEKFFLSTPEVLTWFDGTTQWAMLVDANEVNITNPTEEELKAVNPYVLLQLYKNGFDCTLDEQGKSGNGKTKRIVLIPTEENELEKIILEIDTEKQYPVSIEMINKNKSRNKITVSSYKEKMKHPKEIFVFNKSQYPQTEIIDLR